ncbi:MAG: hypothetical protein LBN23_04865 [Paludibacter sp.]|jgi:sarcosine oxidase delta subunit|nr:hypothetical protein [Paludibacter sp.]
MKQKIFYLLALAAIFSLTSCNSFLLENVCFSEADQKYIDEHSFEIVTSVPIDIIELNEYSAKPEVKNVIPAKTRLKVLAMQGLSTEWGSQSTMKPYFMVELPDGSRKLVKCMEAFGGFRAKTKDSDEWQSIDKVVVEKNKNGEQYLKFTVGGKETVVEKFDIADFPRYNSQFATSQKNISEKKIERDFIGKTLKEVEQKLTLADRITVKGQTQTAYFSGYLTQNDSIFLSPLALTVENGTVTAIDYSGQTVLNKNSKLYKFRSLLYAFDFLQSHNWESLTYPHQWAKSNSWLKDIRPPGTWRIVISIILNILLILVTFVFIFPWLIKKAFFYIKPLSNNAVIALGRILFVLLTIWALFFFGLIQLNFSIIVILAFFGPAIWVGYAMIKSNAESDRCPYCHTVDKLTFVGKGNERTSKSESERTQQEYVAEKVHYKGNERVGTSGRYDQVTEATVTTTEYWNDNYHCNACGRNIDYRHSKSDSRTFVTGRKRGQSSW